MTTFFSTFFSEKLFANQDLLNNANIGLRLFRESPKFNVGDSRYVGLKTTDELLQRSGWVETTASGYPLTNTVTVARRRMPAQPAATKNNYTLFLQFPFTGMGQAEVKAAAFHYVGTIAGVVNPLIMVTDTPFDLGKTVVKDNDAITVNPDATLSAPNRWLLGWADPGSAPSLMLVEGPLSLFRGPPFFESSHTQHVWIYPQRANMIANPSFDTQDTAYWSTNGTGTAVQDGTKWVGKFTGSAPGFFTPGLLTTPDTADLQITSDVVFVAKVKINTVAAATSRMIINQRGTTTDVAFSWFLGAGGHSVFRASTNGTAFTTTNNAPGLLPSWVDNGDIVTLSASLDVDNGAAGHTYTTKILGPNGWELIGNNTVAGLFGTGFNSTSLLRIGQQTGGSPATFDGTIYWVEMRTGLDPDGGTVIAKFNANDYVSGTTTTSGGRVWTTVSGTITPKVGDPTVDNVVVESNYFLTASQERWTIQCKAKGNGELKIGFVWWEGDFEAVYVDWGTERFDLNPESFTHCVVTRAPVQTYQGMVRFECDGTSLSLDEILCEVGFLKQWPYFDGASTYGARSDFSWYGGEGRAGKSYSMWYNNKRATFGRLFGLNVGDDTLITDEEMVLQGKVYQWIPAGTTVVPHIDVLYPNDLQSPVTPKPPGVLPYRIDIEDVGGLVNPWLPPPVEEVLKISRWDEDEWDEATWQEE